jgi:hypothetical protein
MNNLKITTLLLLLSLAGCKRNGGNNGLSTDMVTNGKTAKITFDQKSHDFGVITDDVTVMYDFDFTNTGDGDLIIADVRPSCSCTASDWPKDPIKPGGKGSIKIKFNPAGKSGIILKEAAVEANTNPKVTNIEIKADIHPTPEKK